MKKLFLILVLIISANVVYSQAFYEKTKHKPINKMTRKQVRQAQRGYDLYRTDDKGTHRNTTSTWSTIFRPKYYLPSFQKVTLADKLDLTPKTGKAEIRRRERNERITKRHFSR